MINGVAPLQHSDLIFSHASSQIKDALGQLKKHNLSIKNRLRSIKQDSQFVCAVSDAYKLPLVANERCGSWYIPPQRKTGSAYFKSTDGHFGQWSFSLRRLNLQLLDVVGEFGGCVIVDSTRRGKSMPDALSKTVPIWVCVLNRLLFPGDCEGGELLTPMDVVGESEHIQIEERLEQLLLGVRDLGLELDQLREKLNWKPMTTVWQRPGDGQLDSEKRGGDERHLIVLCTASNQTSNETSATSDYVQGAADDPESWSCGLDAAMFWKYQEELLQVPEDELPGFITTLATESFACKPARGTIRVHPTTTLHIGTNEAVAHDYPDFDITISCTTASNGEAPKCNKQRYIQLPLPEGRNGSRLLRIELLRINAIQSQLLETPNAKILLTCETGKDLSVGVALALLCLFFDDKGVAIKSSSDSPKNITKKSIKQRLSWIMVSIPDASPSRATLQSVNAFLMG